MLDLIRLLLSLGQFLPLADLVALVKALAALPSDPCDRAAVAAYLAGTNDPLAGVVSALAAKFHKHAVPESAADLEAVVVAACKEADPKGWEQLLPLILPLIQQLFQWWQNRRKQVNPTPVV